MLAFSACGASEEIPEIHRNIGTNSVASGSLMASGSGSRIEYTSFSPARIAGKPSILFFAKDTDPFSKVSDQRLQALYGSGSATISTYRVPFNESAELQLKYGVFVEDTFVLVGTGAERMGLVIHPSETELRKIVEGHVKRISE